jgi:hypothetical protein
MHRRSFLKASTLAPAALAIAATPGLAEPASPLTELASKLDVSLFAPRRAHRGQADGLAIGQRARPHARPRRGRHLLSRLVLWLLPRPVRRGRRRAVTRRDDRRDLGGLIRRIVDGERPERLAAFLTGDSKTSWPAAKMHTTSIDCYSGERLVVSQATARKNGIPLAHGTAASCSLPGIIGPTQIGQRYGMDGGMCSNPAHVDLVAGSKRAVIVTLNDGLNPPFLTGIPHPIGENIAQFEATGTKTLWIKADPPNVNLMNPDEIAPALRAGYDRAKQEAGGIKSFWS